MAVGFGFDPTYFLHEDIMNVFRTQDLIGPALDWAVATLRGYTNLHRRELRGYERPTTVLAMDAPNGWIEFSELNYSTDWAQGGPIIEREEIGIRRNAPCSKDREWEAMPSITAKGAGGKWGYGPTPLIAAMRCYVASKLGDEIDIPDELA